MKLAWKTSWWLYERSAKLPPGSVMEKIAARALRQYMQDVMDKLNGVEPNYETRRLGMRRVKA